MTEPSTEKKEIPFWNVNLPEDKYTEECPPYLAEVSDSDRVQLAIPDAEYKRMTWEEVKEIIENNELEKFRRVPSDLHRYRKYVKDIGNEHGSVMDYVMSERLKWTDKDAKGTPFECEEDIKILYNDWPYGTDPELVHLVVWVKFSFEEDPETGDLTRAAREGIEEYVMKTFGKEHDRDNLIWWKNWAALKSVQAIEHFHVMLYKSDADFVKKITDGDIGMSQRSSS